MYIDGKLANIRAPSDAIRYGIGFVTEDRKRQGLLPGMPVMYNISLASLPDLSPTGFINHAAEEKLATTFVDNLQVKTPSLWQLGRNLSGGNQQKVVLAKWLAKKCEWSSSTNQRGV